MSVFMQHFVCIFSFFLVCVDVEEIFSRMFDKIAEFFWNLLRTIDIVAS